MSLWVSIDFFYALLGMKTKNGSLFTMHQKQKKKFQGVEDAVVCFGICQVTHQKFNFVIPDSYAHEDSNTGIAVTHGCNS